MSADCQIDGCGVLAVGRCRRCSRAFCTSHQAWENRLPLTDRCSACKREDEERASADAQARWQTFLGRVRACEARPFPRLLAGAVLRDSSTPQQAIPWCLYDPSLNSWASLRNDDLRQRVARDFVEEARRREVQAESRVRSGKSVTKGFFVKRKRWERIYGDGWLIPEGSDRWSGGKSDVRLSAIIWTDGSIGAIDAGEGSWGRLHEGCLATMAEILGVNTTPQID